MINDSQMSINYNLISWILLIILLWFIFDLLASNVELEWIDEFAFFLTTDPVLYTLDGLNFTKLK